MKRIDKNTRYGMLYRQVMRDIIANRDEKGLLIMKIIKRSGSEDVFDLEKIEAAIRKANDSVIDYEKLSDEKIQTILANEIGRAHV